MFALSLDGGQCISTAPDVCKTPTPSGTVPTPYVNIFDAKKAKSNTVSKKVFICGAKALTIKAQVAQSNGDEAGVSGGVVSGKNMKQGEFSTGSMKVCIEGQKAVMQTSLTKHNNANTIGMCAQAAQSKVSYGA
jgi:hypothetical protein